MTTRSRRRKRPSGIKIFAYSVIIVGAILFFAYQRNQLSGQDLDSSAIPQQVTAAGDPWTQVDYNFRRKLDITNALGGIAEYHFDHAEMVDSLESKTDGTDLKIVAQTDGTVHDVSAIFTGVNTSSANVKFDTSDKPNATYYLYFGNKQKTIPPQQTGNLAGQNASRITAGETQQPAVSMSTTKYWVLKYNAGTKLEANIAIDSEHWASGDKLFYGVAGTSDLKPIEINFAWTNPVEIDLGNIKSGEQAVFLVVQHDGNSYRSPNTYMMISEPLFVAWTIDWEGKNVTDAVLNSISKIANTYDMPLTQFFNPRIYVDTAVPEYRKAQLTNWIKARELVHHDELSLHLHMYFDLVKAAGVTPRKDPHWGSGTDGYDVPASSYTADEMGKILRWAVNQLESNGLSTPKGFRAGGWYANLATLQAVNDNGFVYDSSGRESYKFGADELPGTWNLPHTQQPYHPSTKDQNSASPDPVFRIWEMPNNGNDSYWFSADDMISRFYANYKAGEALSEHTLVTYLSHPDWFDVDQPKLTKLFLEIDKYSNVRDQGPVVYTTLSDALKEWQN